MNRFDQEKHEYTMDGTPVPSVTKIIPKPDFSTVPSDRLEKARMEGVEDHAKIKMYFDTEGDTFGDPMLEALDRFMVKNAGLFGLYVCHERPMYSAKHRMTHFAGTADVICTKAIIDFKRTPGNSKLHALQLAGYQVLAKDEKLIGKTKTWIIAWYDGGEFKMRNVYNPMAESIFMTCLKGYYCTQAINQYRKGE